VIEEIRAEIVDRLPLAELKRHERIEMDANRARWSSLVLDTLKCKPSLPRPTVCQSSQLASLASIGELGRYPRQSIRLLSLRANDGILGGLCDALSCGIALNPAL
jgi:hypothetical protein